MVAISKKSFGQSVRAIDNIEKMGQTAQGEAETRVVDDHHQDDAIGGAEEGVFQQARSLKTLLAHDLENYGVRQMGDRMLDVKKDKALSPGEF